MSAKEYFFYIMGEIVPEVKTGRLNIVGYDSGNPDDYIKSDFGKESPFAKLIYIRGTDQSENVRYSDNHIFSVRTNATRTEQLARELELCDPPLSVVSNFVWSRKPAILFQAHNLTLYFLFDLKELVCRVSRLEDEQGSGGNQGRFLASYHIEETRWKIPILEVLGKLIRSTFEWAEGASNYGIIMTHDVDRVAVEPVMLLRSLVENRSILKRVLYDRNDYLFHYIKELIILNGKKGIKSIWFLLSGNYSLRRYGNRYNNKSRKARELIESLKNNNQGIGLHTSYYSAFNSGNSAREKKHLEKICGTFVSYNRNHYLRFDIRKSIEIYEECGFTVDSTIGYSDVNGFRSGLCRAFRPWNYQAGRISKVLEIPLLFMDSVHRNDLAESWNDVERVLSWIDQVKGCGTVLFHPCFLAERKENQEFYEDFIQKCNRMNIPFLSVNEVLKTI